MGEYVAAIWGWDDDAQRAYHYRVFSPRRWQIITADGMDVGMLDVERRPDELYLAPAGVSSSPRVGRSHTPALSAS